MVSEEESLLHLLVTIAYWLYYNVYILMSGPYHQVFRCLDKQMVQ